MGRGGRYCRPGGGRRLGLREIRQTGAGGAAGRGGRLRPRRPRRHGGRYCQARRQGPAIGRRADGHGGQAAADQGDQDDRQDRPQRKQPRLHHFAGGRADRRIVRDRRRPEYRPRPSDRLGVQPYLYICSGRISPGPRKRTETARRQPRGCAAQQLAVGGGKTQAPPAGHPRERYRASDAYPPGQ